MAIASRSGITPMAAKTIQTFTTAGTHTWNRPEGCVRIKVSLVGAGGGGAGFCEAGGAGGYSEKYIDVTDISSVTITVGAGGDRVAYNLVGNSGGTTSFGSYLSASGGFGANENNNHEGGRGGLGSGGQLNLYGGKGSGHGDGQGSWGPNTGGVSFFGGGHGRRHSTNSSTDDDRHCAWGAGGSGGDTDTNVSQTGSHGAHGAVVVYEFYNK